MNILINEDQRRNATIEDLRAIKVNDVRSLSDKDLEKAWELHREHKLSARLSSNYDRAVRAHSRVTDLLRNEARRRNILDL